MKKVNYLIRSNNRKALNAFTIIELLVVIAIIGLLTGMVLIAVAGAREKGRIAALQQFSASIHSGLGSNLLAEYTFDDPANLGKDSSGNNNDLTGSYGSVSSYTGAAVFGKALDASPDGEFYYDPNGTPNLVPKSGSATIETWIFVSSSAPQFSVGLFAANMTGGWDMSIDWRGVYLDSSGSGPLISCSVLPINNMLLDKWNHFVQTYNYKTKIETLYVNAKIEGQLRVI